MLTLFIGHDDREDAAFKVAAHSAQRRCSVPIEVVPLRHKALRARNLFWREWHMDAGGQWWDKLDGMPFSTQFSFTRFLVPEIARRNKLEWAIFADCDFLFLDDLAKILDEICCDDYLQGHERALYVHKRDALGIKEGLKMDGVQQSLYAKKLWSSLMVFNMRHRSLLKHPTLSEVNEASGGYLHSLAWLPEEEVGALDPRWNYVPQLDLPSVAPRAVHYSIEAPWFEGQENCLFAKEWLAELAHLEGRRKVLL